MEIVNHTAIIGAGPAGLFAAWLLLKEGYRVDLYDRNKQAGLKLLLAGKSGLNLTSSSDIDTFSAFYGNRAGFFEKALTSFSAQDTINWYHDLGWETITGSGKKVFPKNKDTKELRDHWISEMEKTGRFVFHGEHQFVNWQGRELQFKVNDKMISLTPKSVIFALGGASWPGTGSDGAWLSLFQKKGVSIQPFRPMNCAFLFKWTDHLIDKFKNTPLKNISVIYSNESKRGDLLIRDIGLEGGPLYYFSRDLVNQIYLKGECTIMIDLTPDLSFEEVLSRLEKGKGKKSYSSFLKKEIHLSPLKIALLYERETNFSDIPLLAQRIKGLPLTFKGTDKLEKAISTMGGIDFISLDENLMLKDYPGFFTAGEMADWESPTGGFLLQGCFTTAFCAVRGVIKYHENLTEN